MFVVTSPSSCAPASSFVFAHDACHPTDAGHEVYTEAIIKAFGEIRKASKPGKHVLGKPYREDNGEDAKLVAIESSMLTGDWQKLPADNGRVPKTFKVVMRQGGEKKLAVNGVLSMKSNIDFPDSYFKP